MKKLALATILALGLLCASKPANAETSTCPNGNVVIGVQSIGPLLYLGRGCMVDGNWTYFNAWFEIG